MRFLILLIFGGMGAGLLYLGWTRYQTATNEVNTWPKAEGVVAGADGDGYTVQYQVAGEEFVASGGRWFGWPKVKDGERLAVVYDPAAHGRGRIDIWQEIYQETALILMFAAIGLFLGVGGFVFMGGNSLRADEVVTAEQMGVVAEYERPVSMSLGEAVEWRHPANSVVMMGVGGGGGVSDGDGAVPGAGYPLYQMAVLAGGGGGVRRGSDDFVRSLRAEDQGAAGGPEWPARGVALEQQGGGVDASGQGGAAQAHASRVFADDEALQHQDGGLHVGAVGPEWGRVNQD